MPSRILRGASLVTYGTRFLYIALGVAMITLVASCNKEDSNLTKMYTRTLILQHVKDPELDAILKGMAMATNTSQKDAKRDTDGNDMFLFSSSDVVVFVRRKFDEPCNELGCSWKVDISAVKASLPEASQKEVVDAAFTSMVGVGDVHSHLSVENKQR